MTKSLRILVIRLGALGDFVQSFGPFAAIRSHHHYDHITLLTTQPFAELAKKSPWFDSILIDQKPSWTNMIGLWRLKRQLEGFDFVYDLQTSSRSSRYFRLAGAPQWSGIAKGASHPHDNPQRNEMHTIDRQRDQLMRAGINEFPEPALSWLCSDLSGFIPQKPYVVFVPGSSGHRIEKRWPILYFSQLAQLVYQKGFIPVIIGTSSEKTLAQKILEYCPHMVDLTGKTTLLQLGSIMQNASKVIGNDTGPMHLAAMVGVSCLVLFSSASNPLLTAPRGQDVKIVYQSNLKDLSVEKVVEYLDWKDS